MKDKMSSMYSLPARDNDPYYAHDIPLRDLNHPQLNQQVGQIEHREMEKKNRRYKWSIYMLGALVFIIAILAVTFVGLFLSNKGKLPETPNNCTSPTSTMTIITSIPGETSTRTQTLPPVTQTTTHNETKISHKTTVATKTSVLTSTDTTSITVTQSSEPKRCNNNQEYGGQELHDINGDYDLLLVDAIQNAASKGLDIRGVDVLDVAVKSVFRCTNSPLIELVEACKSGFQHDGGGVVCNSGGSYISTTRVSTVTTLITSVVGTEIVTQTGTGML
jgi:hypothetical protein